MRTLDDLLAALFPDGTSFPEVAGLESEDDADAARPSDRFSAPSWPPDVFAYAAKLLDLSGAYHHVSPETSGPGTRSPIRRLVVTDAERADAVRVGRRWSAALRRRGSGPDVAIPVPPSEVLSLWNGLRAAAAAEIFVELDVKASPPGWWRDALMLLMIADEAAFDLGFDGVAGSLDRDPTNAMELFLTIIMFLSTERRAGEGADNFYSCSFANQNVLAVLPKSRTPPVGCTLRSLSHNLALVPPGGEVRVRWVAPHEVDPAADARRPLKILIVPYPYHVEPDCFEPVDVAAVGPAAAPWGWFHILPKWLGSPRRGEAVRRSGQFADFVVGLVDEAGRDGIAVDAVVLPEAALNETFFDALFDALFRRCPGVELLVSGVSDYRDPSAGRGVTRRGNFVAQAVFVNARGKRHSIRTVREKHHRWRLERSQIETYDLGSRLNPATLWWEGIDITSRSLDMVTFRPGATMTTLICEDLARVDPCQGAVRAVGPTLLLALLMDGSQLNFRWPARYATVLAEDPGCSVLTVSSLGLVARSRLVDGSKPRWSVALWRDDTSGPVEVVLRPGHHAVCLVADPVWRTECTLDGRQDGGQALAWRLRAAGEHSPRSVKFPEAVPDWIEKGVA